MRGDLGADRVLFSISYGSLGAKHPMTLCGKYESTTKRNLNETTPERIEAWTTAISAVGGIPCLGRGKSTCEGPILALRSNRVPYVGTYRSRWNTNRMGFAIKSHVYIQAWDEARNAVGNEVALKVRLQITKRIRIEDFTSITTYINVMHQIRDQTWKVLKGRSIVGSEIRSGIMSGVRLGFGSRVMSGVR